VIEICFSASIENRTLEKIVDRLSKYYPTRTQVQTVNINIDSVGSHQVHQTPLGYRLASHDQASVAIVNQASLAAASLAPYPGWGELRERLKIILQTWNSISPRFEPQRIGVRTINRIDIPQELSTPLELRDYIIFRPVADAVTLEPLVGYFLQATFKTAINRWSATINSTMLVPPPLLRYHSVLLDIDIFRTEDVPMNEKALWPIMEEAHSLKNDIFERCITDKTRGLFQ
jgi:uncharacterized protein (TIGR04255 family)